MSTSKEEFRKKLNQGGEMDALAAAMEHIAECCREIMYPPVGGTSLGAILVSAQFESILHKQGLAMVPEVPTADMKAAWKQGVFRNFYERYGAMLRALRWPTSP